MKLKKQQYSILLIYAVIAVVFTVLTFVIPFSKPAGSLVMYAFSLVAAIGGCGMSLYFLKSEDLTSRFYGFPIFRLGYLYVGAQLLLTVLIYIIGALTDVPYWVGLSLSVVLAALVAIGLITAENVRDYVEQVDAQTVVATQTMKRFYVEVGDLNGLCKNPDLAEPLKKLVEKFRYSDPVSSPTTEESEVQIQKEIEILRNMINTEKTETVLAQIEDISRLLSSRNRMCELTKNQRK